MDDCVRNPFGEGMCWTHLKVERLARGDICGEPGCGKPRLYATFCAAHGSAHSRQKRGLSRLARDRDDERVDRICVQCGTTWRTFNKNGKYCSDVCKGAAYKHPLRYPPVLVTDVAPFSVLPRKHPARRRLVLSTGRTWVAGNCQRCGGSFVIVDQTTNRYCSTRCAVRDAKDRRRAVKKQAYVADVYRQRIFERDHWRCVLCGKLVAKTKVVPHPKAPVIDHILPLSKGGSHEPANVQCAHFLCNSLKSDGGTDQLRLIG